MDIVGRLRGYSRARSQQFGEADKVVGGQGQSERSLDPSSPPQPGSGLPSGGLCPTEDLLDALAAAQTDIVARMAAVKAGELDGQIEKAGAKRKAR